MCSVSGSVKPAQDGTLVILVGSTVKSYEKSNLFFDVLGKTSIHVGVAGVASSAKLAINCWDNLLKAWRNYSLPKTMVSVRGHAQYYQRRCGNGITK
jgi:hypothetical protein